MEEPLNTGEEKENPSKKKSAPINIPSSSQENKREASGVGNTKPKRRPVYKHNIQPNDVYISEKSSLRAQLHKCKKLFDDDNYEEVFLHGLGKAIPRTINVALELKNSHYKNTLDFETETSTVRLIDDLIPQDDTTPASYSTRNVSSVKLRLFRTVKFV